MPASYVQKNQIGYQYFAGGNGGANFTKINLDAGQHYFVWWTNQADSGYWTLKNNAGTPIVDNNFGNGETGCQGVIIAVGGGATDFTIERTGGNPSLSVIFFVGWMRIS